MNFRKIFILIFLQLITFVYSGNLLAEIIKEIKISGNSRLSESTIKLFAELEIGQNLNQNELNETLIKLYKTGYFKNVKFNFENGFLSIDIIENPIIEKILISGVKNKTLLGNLNKTVKKIEKYPYTEEKIEQQKNIILNIVKNDGFFFATVIPKISFNENGTLIIEYIFNLKDRAKIKNIKFTGDKKFKTSKLKNLILSEESRPWKFLSQNIFINEERINIDLNLLSSFYKNKGYYNINIKSSNAKIKDSNDFELIFNIDSGKKYFFNDLTLNLSDDYDKRNFSKLEKLMKELKGDVYSLNLIKKITSEIDNIVLLKEYVFINILYDEKTVEPDKINIDFYFSENEKTFVDRINILGNYYTEEKVIRNSLLIDEGDPFNEILFNKSINNLKSKNIFKTVQSNVKKSEVDNKNKILNILVEEKPTGEIAAGFGTGTAGSTLFGSIKELNYLGKGLNLEANLSLSDEEIKGLFSINNPNFRNTDRSFYTTVQSTVSDFMSSSGYKNTRTGFEFGTGFEQYQDLNIRLGLSNYYEKLETSNLATEEKKKQEGDYFENLFSYSLFLNKLNQKFQPTDGYSASFSQTLPIYSDDKAVENQFRAARYYSINEDLILSAQFLLTTVNSLDDNVRVSKRVYIPASRLRGFESGSIGPKDGNQYIGGNYGTAVNFNTTLPNLLKEFENLDFNLFLDLANLWHVDYDDSLDSNKLRSSFGISANWFTPVGPLSFSYAIPLTEAKSDKTENFRFQIGTSF